MAPVIGFAGVAGADEHLEAADPIGEGNFCEAVGDDEPFTDVSAEDPSRDEIICLVATEITIGVTATTYEPNSFVTRRQMALFLTRLADEANRLEIDDQVDELPEPGDPEFSDVADESEAVRNAISQLAQAEVAGGFPDGTYRPGEPVSRRQMAAFIDRLFEALGNPLPRADEDHFSDDDADSAAAQSSTNAVADAGIFIGNDDGTFSPARSITRRQMANVLTRTLQVMYELEVIEQWRAEEAPPESNQTFAVTPDTAMDLEHNGAVEATTPADDRTFTVSGLTDGTTYRIALFPGANVTVDDDGVVTFRDVDGSANLADGEGDTSVASIVRVNNAVVTATGETTATPVGGTITFTIDGSATGTVVPVIYVDSDGDTNLDLGANDQPTEPFGIGGVTRYLPAEGAGASSPGLVSLVDKTNDFFVAAGGTYYYDANDAYQIGGTPSTFAAFEAALSSGDTVTGVYAPDPDAVSQFNLVDDNPGTPTIGTASQSGNTVVLTWTAPGGDVDFYNIYRALSANNTDCSANLAASYTVVGTDTASPFTDSSVTVPEQYCYQVAAVNDGDEGTRSDATFVSLTAADATAPTVATVEAIVDGGFSGQLDAGDTHRFIFSEPMAGTIDDAGSSYRVQDADGTIADIVCGTGSTCTLNAAPVTIGATTYPAGTVLTVAVTATPTAIVAGTTPGLQYDVTITQVTSHWDDVAGNQLNLAGSPDRVINVNEAAPAAV